MARDIDDILNGTEAEEKYFDSQGQEGGADGIQDVDGDTAGGTGGSISEAESLHGQGGDKAQAAADAERKAAEEAKLKAREEAAKALEILDENRVKVGDKVYITDAALREERANSKELRQELSGLRENMQKMLALKEQMEEFRKHQQAQQQHHEEQERDKRYEEDPVRALREDIEEIRSGKFKPEENRQEQERQQGQGYQQEQGQPTPEQVEQLREFGRTVASQVSEFKKDHADYDKALEYVTERRKRDYQLYGYQDENAIKRAIDAEAMQLAYTAVSQGKNPGELVYEMAKAWGWSGEQGKGKPEEEIRRQAEGLRQSGLSGGDAAAIVKDIADMSDKEFDALWLEMEKSARGS